MKVSRFGGRLAAKYLTGVAASSLGYAPAIAQDLQASQDSSEAGQQEIIVTAQRRSERLVDVPMSVVAIAPDAVEKAGVVSIMDINKLAPGVNINFAGCCSQPSIRGISALTTGVGFENNVAIYVDGFYAPDNVSINGDMANLESIEVLKGPQGALWGRNATGGAILMNTRAPSDHFTGKVEAGYASFDELTLSGYVSGPISDHLRFSLTGYNRKSDGFYDLHDANGNRIGNAAPIHQASVRGKLEVDLGRDTTATLGANYGYSSDPRGNIFTYIDHAAILKGKPFKAYYNDETAARAKLKEGTLKLVHQADFGTITSYTGYAVRDTLLAYDYDGSPKSIYAISSDWKQKTFQQAIDANITSVRGINLVVGGSYYHDDQSTPNQLGYSGTYVFSLTQQTLKAEALAAYADLSIDLTAGLVLEISGRYTHEKKSTELFKSNPATGDVTFPRTEKTVSFDNFSPRGTLRYQIGPSSNVYASISTGFRSGGWNPNGAPTPAELEPFDSETITAYEVGYKTGSRAFHFETAAFYYDFKNLQVGQTKFVDVGGTQQLFNVVYNAPKAEIYGIDALISAEPLDNLSLRLGGALLHARYRDFTDIAATGLNATTGYNISGQLQDWSNKEMARSPKFSGNFSADYTFENVLAGNLTVGGNLTYTSSFVPNSPSLYGPLGPAGQEMEQRYRQGAYALLNLQAGWTDASERYKISVYVNNVTDHVYMLSYNGGGYGDYASWGQPRTYGVRITANF